jgi:hypothetical protein
VQPKREHICAYIKFDSLILNLTIFIYLLKNTSHRNLEIARGGFDRSLPRSRAVASVGSGPGRRWQACPFRRPIHVDSARFNVFHSPRPRPALSANSFSCTRRLSGSVARSRCPRGSTRCVAATEADGKTALRVAFTHLYSIAASLRNCSGSDRTIARGSTCRTPARLLACPLVQGTERTGTG